MTDLIEVMARGIHLRDPGPVTHERLDQMRRDARSALTALEQAGWRVVPVTPTAAMLEEVTGFPTSGDDGYLASENATEVWAYMVEAAPKITP